jgi:hypothetical protein
MRKTIYLVVLVAALTGSADADDMPQPDSPSEITIQGDIEQPLSEMILVVLERALSLI